ncbi:hypothetical protein [Streptomyces sp. MA5143a]|uniref:hypothetical protein n=1 Tax=Streptomyces sp. MA5143a TaxID=2083010 RepID=UPI000D2D6101|nr:hypothetical protein [Streptomyces sp. MA5143a]SPF05630.1 hypothetical protein SMA5143A_6446 [Streptomyces sp. MA5143a]
MATAHADIWAWACCVICAAHGSSPFTEAGTGAIIRRIVDTGPDTTALDALHGRHRLAHPHAVTRTLKAFRAARYAAARLAGGAGAE